MTPTTELFYIIFYETGTKCGKTLLKTEKNSTFDIHGQWGGDGLSKNAYLTTFVCDRLAIKLIFEDGTTDYLLVLCLC
jgi:hypothetical protein